ncbi:hypothetical protein LXL04_032925 [Taraxacum kok-saghyz]
MDMRISKMVFILLVLCIINGHHASRHLQDKPRLVFVNKMAHGGGGGGDHAISGHVGGDVSVGNSDVMPTHNASGVHAPCAQATQTYGHPSDGNLPTASLLLLASTMLGLVVLMCFP